MNLTAFRLTVVIKWLIATQLNEGRYCVSNQNIRVTARVRSDGIDLALLAQALLELVEKLPERERDRLAGQGKTIVATAEEKVRPKKQRGAA